MAEKVLLVDDDENVLQGYYRSLHRNFPVEVALGGIQALQAVEGHGPFAVMVVDMGMPGMNGLEVLEKVRTLSPDTTRIMLTGYVDQKTAVDAVNHGQVFRFLNKPCSPEDLAASIEAGIRQYRLVRAEKDLLEQTLMGSIQVISELLSCTDPEAFGRAEILKGRIRPLGERLGVEDLWTLEAAALLSPIGKLAQPSSLAGVRPEDPRRMAMLDRVPEVGAKLLASIPRMEGVAAIVRYQAKGFDGSGPPADGVEGEALPIGARILMALSDFTAIEASRLSALVALEEMGLRKERYDPVVLHALAEWFGPSSVGTDAPRERALPVAQLQEGMVLTRSIVTTQDRLVLLAGLRLGAAHLQLLGNLQELLDLKEPVMIRASGGPP